MYQGLQDALHVGQTIVGNNSNIYMNAIIDQIDRATPIHLFC